MSVPDYKFNLTNGQRAELRRAVTSHAGWSAFKAEHNMTSGDLDRRGFPTTVQAAVSLGIYVKGVIGETQPRPRSPLADWSSPIESEPSPAPRVSPMGDAPRDVVDNALRSEVEALRARVAKLEKDASRHVVVIQGDAPKVEIEGTAHPLLATLLKACGARDARGNRLNVWIAGPAGSGKTYAAGQVAKAFSLSFAFHGAMTMAHELVGFVDAQGNYHETAFVRQFRNGGVILLDECDAGSNEALLALNAALANGMVSLPNGELVERHADCIVLGAANTFGQGPTAEYIGRAKLDAAFMSRFAVKLHWTYDEQLERDMCGNADWARQVQRARAKVQEIGLKVVIDPRQSMAGAALLAAGFTFEEAADLTYLASLTPDQRSSLVRSLKGL